MSDEREPDAERSPAEERVLTLLTLLRAEAEQADRRLVGSVMRHVRYQRTLREVLITIGSLAEAVTHGVAAILGLPRRSGGNA
ncbi:MAG: hypothetical protein M3Q92_07810 [Actinomycetota bacterium]|nr:hypothetical protein [Actinomycetota bacterium]